MARTDGARHTTPWAGCPSSRVRGTVTARLAAAVLALATAPAFAAEPAAAEGPPPTSPAPRVSPFIRLARQHAQWEERKPVRVGGPLSSSSGRAHRMAKRYTR